MKVRTPFAVAALSLAAWAVPALATPPSSVYYDRSPRHTDPWADRSDDRSGPDRQEPERQGPGGRMGQHGQAGRAPAKKEDDDADEIATIKQLSKQIKELTSQMKELNQKLEESQTPARSGRGESRWQSSEDGRRPQRDQGAAGPMQRGAMGRGGPRGGGGPGWMGPGPMGHGPMGRGMMGHGMMGPGPMGGHGGMGMGHGGEESGPVTSDRGEYGRQRYQSEGRDNTTVHRGQKSGEEREADEPKPIAVRVRAGAPLPELPELPDGDAIFIRQQIGKTPKLPDGLKLPDGMKLRPGDEVIIIRAKGAKEDDAETDQKPAAKAHVKQKEQVEKDDDSDTDQTPAPPHGRQMRHQSRDDG